MAQYSASFMRIRSAALTIIVINFICFILQMAVEGFTESFLFVSGDVFSRPWILITHMFLHGSPYHLLFNMYALLLFGPLIESRIGTRRFLLIYFGSGILAALPYILIPTRSLGASGAIMGILGVTIMLLPHLKLLFFFVIPMTLRTAAIFFVILDVWGIFFSPGVANFAHLVGLGIGLAYGLFLLRKKREHDSVFQGIKRSSSRAKRSIDSGASYRYDHKGIELSENEMDDYLKNGRL